MSDDAALRSALDTLYRRTTKASALGSDPVSFIHRYPATEDREIAAFFAAGLAYGRVVSIQRTLERFLPRLTDHPARFVDEGDATTWQRALRGFQHRWTTPPEVAAVLSGFQRMRAEEGGLHAGFARAMELADGEGETVRDALAAWVARIRGGRPGRNSLLADPEGGSACKRLHLYLRWMVRRDAIDPGGWTSVSPSKLIVPIDVHMHRVGQALGFTTRRQADGKTASEITAGFRRIRPDDPARYDFALTRPGILDAVDMRAVGGRRATPVERVQALIGGSRRRE